MLVVEDEPSFVEALSIGLRREGFTVAVATDGFEALDRFDIVRPDLVLLDVMLPRLSGIDVCRQLRKKSQVPIIMVTAKGSEIDTVVGLEVGADDYVTKPYRLRELVARMRAVLRRSPGDEAGELGPSAVSVGDVSLDPEEHTVVLRGEPLALPLKEFELLHVLLANAGRVLPRDTLIDRVWGSDYVGDTKTLDVHVKRLRSKIEPDPANPTRIVTIRGLGYKFERVRNTRSGTGLIAVRTLSVRDTGDRRDRGTDPVRARSSLVGLGRRWRPRVAAAAPVARGSWAIRDVEVPAADHHPRGDDGRRRGDARRPRRLAVPEHRPERGARPGAAVPRHQLRPVPASSPR